MDKKDRRQNYFYDCKGDLYNVGDTVYYFDKNHNIRVGVVTRIRVEVDGKTLQNSYKVKATYQNIKEIKEDIENG